MSTSKPPYQKHSNSPRTHLGAGKRSEAILPCFTPPIMIATFVIEAALAVWMAMRYRSSAFRAVSVGLLLCLASFQLAEYQVCEGSRELAPLWGRIGLAGITLLPALGMHMIGTVTRRSPLIWIGYAIAAAYLVIFLLIPAATGTPECGGNYVILRISGGWFGILYEAYYLIFVFLAMLELVLRLTQRDTSNTRGFSRKIAGLMLTGYLAFTVPMAITGLLSPAMRRATPSIMCGFALILALILALYVAPLYAQESRQIPSAEPGVTERA